MIRKYQRGLTASFIVACMAALLLTTWARGATLPNGQVIYKTVRIGMSAQSVHKITGDQSGEQQSFKSPIGAIICYPFDVPIDVAVCFGLGKGRYYHRVAAVLKINPKSGAFTGAKLAWKVKKQPETAA